MNSAPSAEPGGAGAGRHHHDAFVSYSTSDKPVADAVVARLEQAGIRCWIASRDVVPGQIWSDAIVKAIEDSKLMVVVFSSRANESRHVLREVEHAMAHDVVVIPLRVESTEPSGGLAYFLGSEHWLDAITPPLDAHIDQLVHVAKGVLAKDVAGTPAVPAPVGGSAPQATGRRRGSRTALIVGGAVVALALVATAVLLAFRGGGDSGTPDPGASPTGSGSPTGAGGATPGSLPAGLRDLEAGTCLKSYFTEDEVYQPFPSSELVRCDQSHEYEVLYAGNAFVGGPWETDPTYPGTESLGDSGHSFCEAKFESYVGTRWFDSAVGFLTWQPGEQAWNSGERWLVCALYLDDKTLTESLKGSGRWRRLGV